MKHELLPNQRVAVTAHLTQILDDSYVNKYLVKNKITNYSFVSSFRVKNCARTHIYQII